MIKIKHADKALIIVRFSYDQAPTFEDYNFWV